MRRSETSWIPIFLFALILLVHGSTLGLSDDEAYYWTLSHHFALGFAYHPPLVTWLEGLSRILLGWFIPENTSFVARVPAIACAVTTLLLAQSWVRESTRERADETKAALVLISFAGLFGLSWMIVPDLPMFVGWTLAWWASWKICFSAKDLKRAEWALAAGLLIAMLSKFSGVLCVVSAVLTVNFWAPRERKGRAMGAIFAAVVLAAAPILIWNARHHWGALIYQLRERHSDDTLSWARYARFWGAQVLTAGIAVLAFTFLLLRRARKGQDAMVSRFALAWILPGALVFCVQPLFSDFKPHWAFVVWWPVVMVLARSFALGADRWLARTQIAYGFAALALILVSCHLPLLALLGQRNPKLDVSNDLYGWREFRARVLTELGPGALDLPVVGSRYQTAGQAAFALGRASGVTLIPRTIKESDEWPELGVTEGFGPQWPRLLRPVLFVTDNRYELAPQFPGAHCEVLRRFEFSRLGYLAKWIELWRCVPSEAPSSSKP